ncbi:hypothetical protein PGT21_003711 [Puccinia graminis f. sp. tritici]|uniref:Uncharacterized protein n=1 Tax=Puccinia graminis f. sp. tritici TaxID=56615 RepID=A0A5B0PIH5_PUCGR|nr:hypothetical protein PGT21_003711 [Puccinia graminis f. sp. tritici]
MKRMRCVHRYRIASQGAMRGPASHRPHRHNRCGESASHRFSDAMPDTFLAMPMLSAGIGLTSLRVDSESDSCPDSDSEIDWIDSSIGLDPLSSVPCSGLKFQTHDYKGRYRSASEKTSRQPEEAESNRWLQSQLDSDRTTGPYLELDCTEYNLIRDRSEVPIKKKLVSVPPPAARITLGTASNTITRLHQLPPQLCFTTTHKLCSTTQPPHKLH